MPDMDMMHTICLRCGKPAVSIPFHSDEIGMKVSYTHYSYCEDCLRKGLELLKAKDEADELSRWINVKDRLPEEHESIFYKLLGTPKWSNSMWKQESEKVLVYVSFPDGTGVVTAGCLHNSDWMTTVSKTLPQTVTHWMPMPGPPKI